MKLLGAEVRPSTKRRGNVERRDETKRCAVGHQCRRHILLHRHRRGSHPYPEMVRDFQSVIGREAREQILEREGRLPDAVMACIGGGSNAIRLFIRRDCEDEACA